MAIPYGDPADLADLQRPRQRKNAKQRRQSPADERKDVIEFTQNMRMQVDASWRATQDWRMAAIESYGFVENEQWDPKDVAFIKTESPTRPILTLNDLLPIVRILSGIERQNREDFKIVPRAGGDVDGAAIMTELFRYVGDCNNLFYQRIRKSNDVNITGRGFLGLAVDYDYNVNGDILLRRKSPLTQFWDSLADDWDGSDRRWHADALWVTEDEAKESWPQFEDVIKFGEWLASESGMMPPELLGDKHADYALFIDRQTRRVRIFDYWYKKRERVKLVVNLDTGDVEPVTERFVTAFQTYGPDQRGAFRFIDRIAEMVRIATFMNWLLLQDKPSPLPYGADNRCHFPITPYVGLQFYKEPKGLVEYLKDPARMKNKAASQLMNHLNRSANSGWKNSETEGADPEALRKFGNVPGVVINYKKIPPDQIEPVQPSPGHLLLLNMGADQIKNTSSINAELQGMLEGSRTVSGKAIEARQKGGLVGNEDLLDNGLLGDKVLGAMLIPAIQETFTPERVFRVVENLALRDPKGTAAMMLQRNRARLPDMIDSALTNFYDYIVDRSAAMASVRQENAAKLVDMLERWAKTGQQVPLALVKAAINEMDIKETAKQEIEAEIEALRTGLPAGMATGTIAA